MKQKLASNATFLTYWHNNVANLFNDIFLEVTIVLLKVNPKLNVSEVATHVKDKHLVKFITNTFPLAFLGFKKASKTPSKSKGSAQSEVLC